MVKKRNFEHLPPRKANNNNRAKAIEIYNRIYIDEDIGSYQQIYNSCLDEFIYSDEERKETIERVFGDCKEQHNLRFTRVRGLLKNWQNATLIFACRNLKKMANWRWKKSSNKPLTISFFLKYQNHSKKEAYSFLSIPLCQQPEVY